MKELSIEDKAKRYDEAIKVANKFKDTRIMFPTIKDKMFPELKVSEDEEVRKALYEYFKKLKDDGDIDETWYGFSYDKILAWLEKQGEQILDNSVQTCKDEKTIVIIPKFRIGDEIKTSNEESLIITKIDEKGYWSEDLFICDFDEECLWDLVEQKHAWSEEDEKLYKSALWHIKNSCGNGGKNSGEFEVYNWLKTLKDRHTWNPSDEQMEALEYFVRSVGESDYASPYSNNKILLLSLLFDLKKLKEE